MPTTLTIPKLQMSTTEGTLTEWLVEDGATVTAGQAIYALETDKSVQEIEAPESGRLIQKAAAGETYPVGTEIGEIVA
ncbi:MAG: biotin/lipoyl-binding protein [Gammaproteobacteria bacterium]|jgi:pyruvate/2-oxoglutarate dehydrogenase complex dihydrolipoamide acyltransferase (E2) component|nr:biotin/lipoyl-binding protein [Gammaproteobacteria bacterium]MBK8992162.1 biotin/lipoyl-binding protein [Gammaproteobacteria bacterium]MBK9470390.1 biotin/lipoyl-binding protein [Gammaproteobacteria bacterium]